MIKMKLTKEEKEILKRMIDNELEYYEMKEDMYQDDIDFIKKLYKILKKLEDK